MNTIVIATGDHYWRDPTFVRRALTSVYVKRGQFTLYHGDSRTGRGGFTGLERHVNEWSSTVPGQQVRTFPIERSLYGGFAELVRDRDMVETALRTGGSADHVLCVAFLLNDSWGALSAATIAERYDIPVDRYTAADVGRRMHTRK